MNRHQYLIALAPRQLRCPHSSCFHTCLTTPADLIDLMVGANATASPLVPALGGAIKDEGEANARRGGQTVGNRFSQQVGCLGRPERDGKVGHGHVGKERGRAEGSGSCFSQAMENRITSGRIGQTVGCMFAQQVQGLQAGARLPQLKHTLLTHAHHHQTPCSCVS